MEWDATWTRLDNNDNLVASWTIERGRSFELDQTDAGRATVKINDVDGLLDPTNTGGPYFGKIEPLLQAAICRWNPVTDTWEQRFRGFIDDLNYKFDPSQRINFLEVSLVDIFEVLAAIEMVPGAFGHTPDPGSEGQIQFNEANMDARIVQVLGDAGFTGAGVDWYVVFTGNVTLYKTIYSPGETPLTVAQEAADAEFPGVSNVYADRFGRFVVHGRLAKFDPGGVSSGVTDDVWDWHDWQAGDGATVAANPAQFAHIRRFAFNRGLSKIINSALASSIDVTVPAQTDSDATSIGQYGIRSRSWPNLLTKSGLLDSSTTAQELSKFVEYAIDNYSQPENRPTELTFRSKDPNHAGASENWRLMSKVDISDRIEVTISAPGGGGFTAEPFFVEGIRESSAPLNQDYDNDTVTLDVSPAAYFADNPFPVS